MNYKKMIAVLFISAIAGTQCIFAADSNALKNSNFAVTTAKNGKKVVAGWKASTGDIATMIVDGSVKGRKAVKLPLGPFNAKTKWARNNIGTSLWKPKAGTYVAGVNLMPSRKFHIMRIVTFHKDNTTKKTVYQGGPLKQSLYPAPGKWVKFVCEIKIPENVESFGIAVEYLDRQSSEGYLLIENPTFTLREE